MIIYLDLLFVKEMLFDAIIIFLTGRIINQKIKVKRLIISSIIGTIYSIIIILINYNLAQNTLLNFMCGVIMNLIAFENKNVNEFLKTIMIFYLVTFVIGGLNLYSENHMTSLGSMLILLLISVPLLVKNYKNKYKLDSYYGKIIGDIDLKVFIDTGNNLTSCYDEPVIILSNKYRIEKRTDAKKIRRISYKTINEKDVCVDGIKIEKIVLEYQNEKYENEAVLINSNVNFEDYDAIVGLEFFERARKICEEEKECANGYFIIDKSKN